MDKQIIALEDIDIERRKFHYSKYPINTDNVDIDKMITSKKFCFGKMGFKYFIGYIDKDKKVKPFFIMLPKISGYTKRFDESKNMFPLVKDGELLEKYKNIWNKVSNSIKKRFNSEPVCNKK